MQSHIHKFAFRKVKTVNTEGVVYPHAGFVKLPARYNIQLTVFNLYHNKVKIKWEPIAGYQRTVHMKVI